MTCAYIINNLLFVVPCILLLLLVFKDQLKTTSIPLIFMSAALFVAASLLGTDVYLRFPSPTQHLFLSMASMFIGIFIFNIMCKYSFWQSLFIISVIKSYSENVRFLSTYIYFLVTEELPETAIFQISVITTLLTILTFPLMLQLVKKWMRPALDYTVSLTVWKLVWVIPICNNAVYTVTITPEVSHYTIYPGNEFVFIPPFWILLTFSTYGILLKMMVDVSKNAALQESLHLSETQISAQKKQMELLQKRIRESSRFRHDMRHHLLAIDGCLERNDIGSLKEYIRQSVTLLPAQASEIFCENSAVNAILCYYQEQAKKDKIKTYFCVLLPKTPPIPDTELCIIIGNLLENAVEACQRMKSQERFLNVSLSMASNAILAVQISNSFEGCVHKTSDGSFLSSKGKDRKGIGLSSVLSITEKYSGISKIEYSDQIFKVSLLISGPLKTDNTP